jgi:hypothetical protein
VTNLADHRDDIAEIRRLIAELDKAGAELLRRDAVGSTRPDSLPTRASGAEPGSSSPPSRPRIVLERTNGVWTWKCSCGSSGDGWAEQDALGEGQRHADVHATTDRDYADPTGEAAVTVPQPDPVRKRARAMVRKRQQVLDVLRAAVEQTREPKLDAAEVAANEGAWCVNHLDRVKACVPPHADGLCRWCISISKGYGRLPNAALLDAHERGERLDEGKVVVLLGIRTPGQMLAAKVQAKRDA